MRDPNRIMPFAHRIGLAWASMPEQRFGQLISNFFLWLQEQGKDPFYMEDAELLERYEAFINQFTDYRAPEIRA